jgi:thymidylate kinase
MLIIIEGIDGSGKTTLAQYLSTMMNYPIIHRSNPKSEEERQNMYADYLAGIESGANAIWDRAFYSEMVYGPIKRDQSFISMEQMLRYEAKLSRVGAIVVHCTCDPHVAYANAVRRGETYITSKEEFMKIHEGYEILMRHNKHLIPVLSYNVMDNGLSMPTL